MTPIDEKDSALVLFTYNRPEHTRRVLKGIRENRPRLLYIYQDGLREGHPAGPHTEVRKMIEAVDFCPATIRTRPENLGLAASIIAGVTEILREHEAVSILEDDCIPSSKFLEYSRWALNRFQDDKRIFSIGGAALPAFPCDYKYDVCFAPTVSTWGWSTWKDRWELFDASATGWERVCNDPDARRRFDSSGSFSRMLRRQMNGEIDSWGIRWFLTHFNHDALCVWPIHSLIQNIGMDGSGVNCFETDRFDVELAEALDPTRFRVPSRVEFDPVIQKAFLETYGGSAVKKFLRLARYPSNWPKLPQLVMKWIFEKYS